MRTLALQIGGKTYSTVREADVKVGALASAIDRSSVTVTTSEAPGGPWAGAGMGLVGAIVFHDPAVFWIGAVLGLFFWLFDFMRRQTYTLPFEGAELQRIDRKTSVRGAAVGLVAGELLFGPIGALAGAAAGLSTTTTVAMKSGDKLLVFQPSESELHALAARGLIA